MTIHYEMYDLIWPSEIKNGQQNKLLVGIENKSGKNITITSIAGSIHHPETGKLIKNVCAWI
jgi:hypothetical protein